MKCEKILTTLKQYLCHYYNIIFITKHFNEKKVCKIFIGFLLKLFIKVDKLNL